MQGANTNPADDIESFWDIVGFFAKLALGGSIWGMVTVFIVYMWLKVGATWVGGYGGGGA